MCVWCRGQDTIARSKNMTCTNELAPTCIKIVQHCSVSPPNGGVQEQLLIPLTNFDIDRLHYHLLHFLFFYKFEWGITFSKHHSSKPQKLPLKHFLSLAGIIVFPLAPCLLLITKQGTLFLLLSPFQVQIWTASQESFPGCWSVPWLFEIWEGVFEVWNEGV